MRVRIANLGNQEFDYGRLKCRIIGFFWLMFIVYSCVWAGFYWVSLDKRDLVYVNGYTSAYFIGLIVLYLVVGCGLRS